MRMRHAIMIHITATSLRPQPETDCTNAGPRLENTNGLNT